MSSIDPFSDLRSPFGFLETSISIKEKRKRKPLTTVENKEVKETDVNKELEEARKRARDIIRNRQGRRSTILTSNRGVTDSLGVVRRARASALLGGGNV